MLKIMIVDDEPASRRRLRELLDRHEEVTVTEHPDVASARNALESFRPDVLFLDVRMPGADGFDLIGGLRPADLPVIVFVTAHAAHAVRAFDVHAADYLLKPFDEERFNAALLRAREEVERRQSGAAKPPRSDTGPPYPPRLALRAAGRVVFLRPEEIDWIDAAGNYVRVHADGRMHEIRESMATLEGELDPHRFARIHRSTIVNLDRIAELRFTPAGGYLAQLKNGKLLNVSRSYRDNLHRLLTPSL